MSEEKIIIDLDEDEVMSLDEVSSRKNMTRIFTFSLGQENYCLSLDQVKEVILPSNITRIPNSPNFVTGVINLRGQVVSVLDIRYFFGLSLREKAKESRILITDVTGSYMGIVVDKVRAIVEIEKSAIQPPLSTLKGKFAEYTKGEVQLGEDILALLDLQRILNNDMINNLRKGVS